MGQGLYFSCIPILKALKRSKKIYFLIEFIDFEPSHYLHVIMLVHECDLAPSFSSHYGCFSCPVLFE